MCDYENRVEDFFVIDCYVGCDMVEEGWVEIEVFFVIVDCEFLIVGEEGCFFIDILLDVVFDVFDCVVGDEWIVVDVWCE